MLFVLNGKGVPSKAKIMRIGAAVATAAVAARPIQTKKPVRLSVLVDEIRNKATGTHLVIGVTPNCPHGLATCWSGLYHAMKDLAGVAAVEPIANADDSTADIYLKSRGLPNLAHWPQQFTHVELSLNSDVVLASGQLVLPATPDRSAIALSPLDPTEIVQLDRAAQRPRAATPAELDAYAQLRQRVIAAGGTLMNVKVTGPLYQLGNEYGMFVRSIT
jgi:hypothetical protein